MCTPTHTHTHACLHKHTHSLVCECLPQVVHECLLAPLFKLEVGVHERRQLRRCSSETQREEVQHVQGVGFVVGTREVAEELAVWGGVLCRRAQLQSEVCVHVRSFRYTCFVRGL